MRIKALATVLAALLALMAASLSRADDPWQDQTDSDDLPVVTSQDGVDRPGSDFWLIRFNSPAAYGPCAFHCRNTPRCAAFTVVRPAETGGQYLCYLKDRIPEPVSNSCCRSGVKEGWRALTAEQLASDARLRRTPAFGEAFPAPAPARPPLPRDALVVTPPVLPISPLPRSTPSEPPFGTPIPGVSAIDGTDRMGSDYRRIHPATTARACAEACAGDQPRCRAYTFVRASFQETAPVCYLKDAVPAESPNPCCVSGVVDGPGSNAAPPVTPARPASPSGSYNRAPGRYEGASESLINQLSSSDRRWPSGVPFNVSGCEAACDNPARFSGTGSESRTCVAYSFMQSYGPYEGTCTTFSTVPPRIAPDDHTSSGHRR
jgi:hypothetical protein